LSSHSRWRESREGEAKGVAQPKWDFIANQWPMIDNSAPSN